jgi:hypothetical protein
VSRAGEAIDGSTRIRGRRLYLNEGSGRGPGPRRREGAVTEPRRRGRNLQGDEPRQYTRYPLVLRLAPVYRTTGDGLQPKETNLLTT